MSDFDVSIFGIIQSYWNQTVGTLRSFPGLVIRRFYRWGTMRTSHILCSSGTVGPACPVLLWRGFCLICSGFLIFGHQSCKDAGCALSQSQLYKVLPKSSLSFLPAVWLSFENGLVSDFVLGGWLSQPSICLPRCSFRRTQVPRSQSLTSSLSILPPAQGSGSPALGKPCLGFFRGGGY